MPDRQPKIKIRMTPKTASQWLLMEGSIQVVPEFDGLGIVDAGDGRRLVALVNHVRLPEGEGHDAQGKERNQPPGNPRPNRVTGTGRAQTGEQARFKGEFRRRGIGTMRPRQDEKGLESGVGMGVIHFCFSMSLRKAARARKARTLTLAVLHPVSPEISWTLRSSSSNNVMTSRSLGGNWARAA